ISGSVRVGAYILRPGFAFTNNKIIKTNIDQDIAWKNGYFNFEGADIQSVMRQLSRWYDIDIKYTGKIKEGKFRGELPRSLNLSEVLEILHDVNIKYRIQGKTLFIE
ncbi:MAG: DUF4974 domain-containing protein, partial [Chitinophagaceae bacterium]|nr:DUF4974 domain-containing protein [Chitinophagaceae bacterium]